MINKRGIECFQTWTDKKYWVKHWYNDNEFTCVPVGINKDFVKLDKEQLDMYRDLTLFLQQNKIKYTVTRYKNSLFLKIKTNTLRGGYSTKSDDCYPSIDQHLILDHRKLFNKWADCPVRFSPKTGEWTKLYESIKLLQSKEGYWISRRYDYLENNPFVDHHFDTCEGCDWKRLNQDKDSWCYMFKDFAGKYCSQFKPLFKV